MDSLYNRLAVLKIILNSNYGDGKVLPTVYEETYKIRKKILKLKNRKEKIKRLFNA
jgi:hypothetical protein